jgi:hypothetical protein
MLAMQIVLAIVVFAAGIATGAGLYALYSDRHQDYYRKHPELAAVRFAERLARPLNLSESQEEQLQQIVQRHWPTFQAIRADLFPRMKSELDNVRGELVTVLSKEQLKSWDDSVDDMARRFAGAASQPASQPRGQPGK